MVALPELNEAVRLRNQKIIEDWISALNALNHQIKQWVADWEQKGALRVTEVPVTKTEEPLGTYQVKMLVMISENNHVDVYPVGRFSLGAIGRVDITNYKKSFSFLYSRSKGWLSLDSRKPLTEPLFFELLDRLLDD